MSTTHKTYTTRIAPSPTGFIHLGNIRTGYHSWLAARSTGGKFILRIDDTDDNRNRQDCIDKVFDAFAWLGLDHDLSFSQSSKRDAHTELAHQLNKAGIAKTIDGGAIALDLQDNDLPDSWKDLIAGDIAITDKDKGHSKNLVILRSNGTPTYNFSSIIDDMNSGVNLIVRGTDHISNTPKQIAVLVALAKLTGDNSYIKNLDFAHVGLVFEKGAKLSKRSGNSNLDSYKDDGIDPDAILNWILRLGWNPTDPEFDKTTPIIDKELAKQMFWTAGKLRNSPASLDRNKLLFLNKKYIHLKKTK